MAQIECICEVCGKTFGVKPSRAAKANVRFCSNKCFGQWRSENSRGANNHNWQGGDIKRTCVICGASFYARHARVQTGRAMTCSPECRCKLRSLNAKGGTVERTCEYCGITFWTKPCAVAKGQAQFCSRKCAGLGKCGRNNPLWKPKIERTCKQCGKVFLAVPAEVKRGGAIFCSRRCQGAWQVDNRSGPNNPNWLGGTKGYPRGWTRRYREEIRERDGYVCRACGKTQGENGQRLCVHHINYDRRDLRPENLVALCNSCHSKTNVRQVQWRQHFMEVPA